MVVRGGAWLCGGRGGGGGGSGPSVTFACLPCRMPGQPVDADCGHSVRGLFFATGQYSSFCGCALGLMLGVLDLMEVEVQDREQVEVRENAEARETEEEDKTRKQPTLRHVITCG